MLTGDEREAVRLAGQLYTFIADRVCGNGPTRDEDLAEVRFAIHAVQHAVMAQAAPRLHPAEFRLMGEIIAGERGSAGGTAPYRCPTPCDEDCEISGWGCHECHDVPSHRGHDPGACEARMLAANLRVLVDGGWQAQFGRLTDTAAVERHWVHLVNPSLRFKRFDGVGPGDVAAQARAWVERGAP